MIVKSKFYTIGLILTIILLCVLVYTTLGNKSDSIKNPYSVVFLNTGDMYFGKISRFPRLALSDIWFLQVTTQEDQQSGFNLAKFSNAVFGPKDKMEINRENVVWISKLADDSQVVSFILQSKDPSFQQNVQPQATVPQEVLPVTEE